MKCGFQIGSGHRESQLRPSPRMASGRACLMTRASSGVSAAAVNALLRGVGQTTLSAGITTRTRCSAALATAPLHSQTPRTAPGLSVNATGTAGPTRRNSFSSRCNRTEPSGAPAISIDGRRSGHSLPMRSDVATSTTSSRRRPGPTTAFNEIGDAARTAVLRHLLFQQTFSARILAVGPGLRRDDGAVGRVGHE